MANRGQTHAKREREMALKERRERKRAKKDQRAAGNAAVIVDGHAEPGAVAQADTTAPERIR